MFKNQLLFHIGTDKTGSTAIQAFLQEHNNMLKNQGWCYPDIVSNVSLYNSGGSASKNPIMNGWALASAFFAIDNPQIRNKFHTHYNNPKLDFKECAKDFQRIISYLMDCLERYNVIVSSELFFLLDFDKLLAKVMEYHTNVKICVYFRRQDEYLDSAWKQLVKADGGTETLQTIYNRWEENGLLDYWGFIKRIESIVGKDALIVKPYEPKKFTREYNVVSDFFDTIGITDVSGVPTKEYYRNIGYCSSVIEVMRLFNKYAIYPNKERYMASEKIYRRLFGECNNTIIRERGKLEKEIIQPEQREELLARHRTDNQMLSEYYSGDAKKTLFSECEIDRKSNYQEATALEEAIVCTFINMMKVHEQYLHDLFGYVKSIIRFHMETSLRTRKLAFWGAGDIGLSCLHILEKQVALFFDNHASKKTIEGIPVILPQQSHAINWKEYFIVITCNAVDEVQAQLNEMGLREYEDYIEYRMIFSDFESIFV